MTISLPESYRRCDEIAIRSGSSFYRSFALLARDRRNAMTALYAFARLADDATDATDGKTQSVVKESDWSASAWHEWLDHLCKNPCDDHSSTSTLGPIRQALADSVARFAIPMETLHDIVRGVDSDVATSAAFALVDRPTGVQEPNPIRMKNWGATTTYCHRVASSVGIACLAIWAKNIGQPACSSSTQAALDCGVAFQMTNILRDIVEDSGRNRIYIPEDELVRFGIDEKRWLGLRYGQTTFAINEMGDWRGLIRLQIERTKALYERGWRVANSISLDGQRMFSLMWHSYRDILLAIEKNPERIWQQRIRLTNPRKVQLVGQHLFTPFFRRLMDEKTNPVDAGAVLVAHSWPEHGPRVAVVGAGLAGIHSALHLARHGCRVTLFESKHRIGGRVGSFVDSETGNAIDYCQHVGMNCCTTLKQWVEDTDQTPFWTEHDSLHFVSANGNRIRVAAWPLPAPYHLSGLLFRWPELGLSDRLRVGFGLMKLRKLKRDPSMASQLAIDWLRANGQSERCIQNFWSTILVSALGEKIDRVTLSAAHKVLIDGFARTRVGFHLLTPNRPLSELLDHNVSNQLARFGVELRLGNIVKSIETEQAGCYAIRSQSLTNEPSIGYDAVVVALPWNKVSAIFPEAMQSHMRPAESLDSSPITGIHTWWDRPWLKEPHAILIDRFCQWVFSSPQSQRDTTSSHAPNQTKEHYYQIVISASHHLPVGDSESILKRVKQDLAEIFPEAAVATMLRGRVVTDPNAVFSVSVGHESNRLASDGLSSKKIWIAGDWTATQWPATMEGALRSGAEAAQGLLTAYGRSAVLLDGD